MTMLDMAIRGGKRFIPEDVKRRIKVALGVPDMEASLLNMKRNGFSPKRVIDVGAHTGEWTRMCRLLFPEARVLMIEPLTSLREPLREMAASDAHLEFSPVLVGARAQAAVEFYEAESASSIFPDSEHPACATTMLPMTTLDETAKNTGFSRPEFIKLDVQGAELSVLEGACETMQSVEAVLMEVNLLEIYSGAPLFDRTVAFMADRGFRVYDICNFFRRPLDNALWQTDVVFVRPSSMLLASRSWS